MKVKVAVHASSRTQPACCRILSKPRIFMRSWYRIVTVINDITKDCMQIISIYLLPDSDRSENSYRDLKTAILWYHLTKWFLMGRIKSSLFTTIQILKSITLVPGFTSPACKAIKSFYLA